jgi:hypothetical protein
MSGFVRPRGVWSWLALFLLGLFAVPAKVPAASVVRLAIAPIGWEFFDGQEAMGESLTPIVLAELSGDPRWSLVERVRLDAIEREWELNQPGVTESAASVVRGRLLGADWMLVLRPSPSPEHPALIIEVVDALRAETVSARPAELRYRPRARWFRNPPAADLQAVLSATRQVLDEAFAVRAAQAGRRTAAVLFLQPEGGPAATGEASALEQAISGAIAAGSGWRVLGALGADAPRGEGLLRAAGFIDEQVGVAPSSIADVFLWGKFTQVNGETRLDFWLWSGAGEVDASAVAGDLAAVADAVAEAVRNAPIKPVRPVDPTGALEQRRRLALQLVTEARASAASAPAVGAGASGPSLATRLLELAAFLEPLDREIQELRIISNLWDLPREIDGYRAPDQPIHVEAARRRINLSWDYARLADRYWRLPGDRYDLRLLAASFRGSATPGFRARAVRAAPIVARMPLAELGQERFMLDNWLRACVVPDEASFTLIEAILPVIARLKPERLYTPAQGGFQGWVPFFEETFPDDAAIQARLRGIIDRLPKGRHAPDGTAVPGLVPVTVENSPAPLFSRPAASPAFPPLPGLAPRSSS